VKIDARDYECPICFLIYSRENPPIILECEHHQYRFCKNQLWDNWRAMTDKTLTIGCPICHKILNYEVKNKEDFEGEIKRIFKIDEEIVNQIYSNLQLKSLVEEQDKFD
jgi:hypothetical protein